MFARHKQAWLTGEKKKAKPKLVSISMAKERAFYTVLYTILILTCVGPLCWSMRSLLLGWNFRACTVEEIKLSPYLLIHQSGPILLVSVTSIYWNSYEGLVILLRSGRRI